MRYAIRSSFVLYATREISSVSSSIRTHSKSSDCHVYDWSSCKGEYTLIRKCTDAVSAACSYG